MIFTKPILHLLFASLFAVFEGFWGQKWPHPNCRSTRLEFELQAGVKICPQNGELCSQVDVQGEEIGTGLLTHPLLMASDILLYQVSDSLLCMWWVETLRCSFRMRIRFSLYRLKSHINHFLAVRPCSCGRRSKATLRADSRCGWPCQPPIWWPKMEENWRVSSTSSKCNTFREHSLFGLKSSFLMSALCLTPELPNYTEWRI